MTSLETMYAWLAEENMCRGQEASSGETSGLMVAVLSLNGRSGKAFRGPAKPPSKARRMRKRHRSRAKAKIRLRRR